MKKRVLIAIALVIALVLIAQTGAWAGKLVVGNESPAAAPADVSARPKGTSDFVNPNKAPPYVPPPTTPASPVCATLSTDPADIGNVAEGSIPGGGTGEACVLDVLPNGVASLDDLAGGTLIELTFGSDETIPGDIKICYNVSADSESVFFWDGEGWVETEEAAADGVLCVTVPEGSPNPTYTALTK